MDVKLLYLVYIEQAFRVHSQVQTVTVDDRLNAVERKFEKVDAVLEGLGQVCSNVRMMKASGESDDRNDIDKPNPKEDRDDNLDDFVPTINLLSVESSGLVDNNITVNVIYRSETNCDIKWNVRYENSTFLTLLGRRQYKIIENSNTRLCVKHIDLPDAEILDCFLVVIFGSDDNVQLSFNVSTLRQKGAELIDRFEHRILKYSPTKLVSDDMSQRVETVVKVTSNVIEAINKGRTASFLYFSHINTTALPSEFREAWSYNNNDLSVEIKNGSDNELLLRVGKALAKLGGYLSLSGKQRSVENKYLVDLQYGIRIRLLNQETKSIMSTGVIAIQRKEYVQYYRGQYHSLSCLGASIPSPDIAIFKVRRDGKMKQLPADIDREDDIIHSQMINFNPTDAEKPDGTYVCRVSLGNEFIDTKFSVTKYVKVVFDERKTRLMNKSSREITISCKASGVPAPEFGLRVNDEFGEDLMQSENAIFNRRVRKRKKNTKVHVMLTFERHNKDISTIICVAKQIEIDRRVGHIKSFPIEI